MTERTCANRYCAVPLTPENSARSGKRCGACSVYYSRTDTERPRHLVVAARTRKAKEYAQ